VYADTRAAIFFSDQTFQVAAGTAPPTFAQLFSREQGRLSGAFNFWE